MPTPEFSDYIVYVDESGDHSLTKIDTNYPIFVLAFIIFRKSDYVDTVVPAFQRLKFKWFGHDLVILHENDMVRKKPPFGFLQFDSLRERFLGELDGIVASLSCTVIATVIRKDAHRRRYSQPTNPYHLALLFCMERAAEFLASRGAVGKTHIVFESRSPRTKDGQTGREDADVELEFRRIMAGANPLQDRAKIASMAGFDIQIVSKQTNSTGLQVADLFARPIGLHALKPDQPNRAFQTIRGKIWGNFKIFP
jgi:hypothetical protein